MEVCTDIIASSANVGDLQLSTHYRCFPNVKLTSCQKLLPFCIAIEYEIATTTANTDDASTTENVWIVLEGRKARSKEFVLENKKKKFLQ